MIAAIVCVDKNWGIGYQGDLLCKIPEDMKFFKEKTINNIVIMGRKTYESLPVKPLPNRMNIIVTSDINDNNILETKKDGTIRIGLNAAKEVTTNSSGIIPWDIYVIGGGQIYKELLPYCDKVYVTEVDYEFENVDTYFPNLHELAEWHITEINPAHEYNGFKYRFCVYEREKEM